MSPTVTRPDTASDARLSPRRLYTIVAVAETVTWTLLILGMLLKYVWDAGQWPVRVFGLTHGIVFVSYAFAAGLVGVNQFWRRRLVVGAIVTAVVPYATIPFDRWLARRGKLDGTWRFEPGDDPRARSATSRALRLFLRHPVLLSVGMVVAVAVVVSVLLWLGPPTQWFS